MRYRLKCLTPLLVGDGRRLSPIDYMVWKDQVNVLDQWRIFRLLAKGPRLDSYLTQLKNAEKLDFATWGGFAQNFAGRRIPFENAAYSAYWNRAAGASTARREAASSRNRFRWWRKAPCCTPTACRWAPPPTWRRTGSPTRCSVPASRWPSRFQRCIDALPPHMPYPAAGR